LNDSVTLTPQGKLNLAKPEELTMNAVLVTNAFGRPIDGMPFRSDLFSAPTPSLSRDWTATEDLQRETPNSAQNA
jgi:hypothetical protein